LIEDYEALRAATLECNAVHPRTDPGRALLMFRGMAAWIHGGKDVAPCRTSLPRPTPNPSRWSAGLDGDLVGIMTTMVLANAMENTP